MAQRWKLVFKRLIHIKSFIAGLVIIGFFIGLSIYAMIVWPFEEAIGKWNDPSAWVEYPELAPPAWIQYLTGRKEIDGWVSIDSRTLPRRDVTRIREALPGGLIREEVTLTFIYDYDVFPRSARLTITPEFTMVRNETIGKIGIRQLILCKPNGVNITLFKGFVHIGGTTIIVQRAAEEHPFIREYRLLLRKEFGVNLTTSLEPVYVLFMDDQVFVESNQTIIRPLKGIYKIIYEYSVPGELSDVFKSVEVQLLLRGTVYGLLGTDNLGRDLFMGIAWGAPIALSFGLLASVITSLSIMIISAICAWFRGVVDEAVSRINEVFIILPFLPTIILISLFYGFTIWNLLGIVIAFSVLGSAGVKTQRAMFLQIREMPYIEAARAYGASSFRIIFRYMVPRVLPVMIPSIIMSVPSFVFLEAALALLGLSDPRTITWGKILNESIEKAALLGGAYHWILAPAISLMLLSIAFAMIGFTLDRVFNPRLKQL